MPSTPEFEPGPHWWEASALTTHCAIPCSREEMMLAIRNTWNVSETSNRDRWERVLISRYRLDWRIRNREALKSRLFLSRTLRYVARKR